MSEIKPPRIQIFKRASLSGEVLVHDDEQLLTTELGNLSAGGLYVKSHESLPVGEIVRVVIKAKGLEVPVQAIGKVVRVEDKKGLAVEFTSISQRSRNIIQECVIETRMQGALSRQ